MKFLLPCFFIVSAILLSTGMKRPYPISQKATIFHDFTTDSGYILKPEAEKLLSQIKYDSDSTEVEDAAAGMGLYDIKITDTIGKFYRMNNGNHLAFLSDITHPYWNVFVLLEITPEGKVLQSELYNAGIHQCCWNEGPLGFKKYANGYFGTMSCGTGSGHCSSYIYLFKDFAPQGNGICSYSWTSWCQFTATLPIACNLSSTIDIKNDTVTMHYTLEHLKERRNGKYKVIDKEKFDIKYVKREQTWVALDSTKISEIPD
ncbi:hypothetical protein ACX0HA_01105 [Flavobacterium hauense]